MTSALPSKSAEFRRVLWTGLYSQLVLMTVPVGGDIGDEVRFQLLPGQSKLELRLGPAMPIVGDVADRFRSTPSTKP